MTTFSKARLEIRPVDTTNARLRIRLILVVVVVAYDADKQTAAGRESSSLSLIPPAGYLSKRISDDQHVPLSK